MNFEEFKEDVKGQLLFMATLIMHGVLLFATFIPICYVGLKLTQFFFEPFCPK